jgi:hypothetical protein
MAGELKASYEQVNIQASMKLHLSNVAGRAVQGKDEIKASW